MMWIIASRGRSLSTALIAAAAVAASAMAAEPKINPPADAPPAATPPASTAPPPPSASPPAIQLVAGAPVEIACETKAVVVAEGAPNATKGALSLRLELTGEAPQATGKWSVVNVDPVHRGSLAAVNRKVCAAGCPLTLGPNGDIQLWAPAAKSIQALAEGEVLLLAVVRADEALRASTFKGQAIEALEEGHCRKVAP
jgi:hypothetical protein